jgi:hypothetical protein
MGIPATPVIQGGPVAAPGPWRSHGDYITYAYGTVVGKALGGNMGPGTINAEALFINGVPLFTTAAGVYVQKAGDTMTGKLALSGDPDAPMEAVTKRYLDNALGAVTSGIALLGVFDASAGTITWNTDSGFSGDAMPPPASVPEGRYLICAVGGSTPPSGAPVGDYNAGDWLICNGSDAWLHIFIDTTTTASNVILSPPVAGADNVQDGITEIYNQVGGPVDCGTYP